jgi:propionyl-CoA carboxylase beta chain
LFDFLPLNNEEQPPFLQTDDDAERIDVSLNTLVPENPSQAYDIKELIYKIVDEGDFFEIKPDFAKNLVVGFARMEGRTVGIVANQPLESAGSLDINASRKGARFIRFCDAFNISTCCITSILSSRAHASCWPSRPFMRSCWISGCHIFDVSIWSRI